MTSISIPDALQLAVQHQNAGRIEQAEEIYLQVLRIDPSEINALSLLGILYAKIGRIPQAVDILTRATQVQAPVPDIYHRLAVAWRMIGRPAEAADACNRALGINPRHAESWNYLGVLFFECGQLEQAGHAWQQRIAIEPTPEAFSNLGVVFEHLGRLAEAEVAYRQSLALNPNYAPGHNNLGATLAAMGKLQEALAEHQAAARIDANFQRAYVNWAHTAQLLGDLDQAIGAANKAVELGPNDPDAWRNLAVALQEKGQSDAVVRAFDSAAGILEQQAGHPGPQQAPAAKLRDLVKLMSAIVLPQVYQSAEDVARWRNRLAENISHLHDQGLRLSVENDPAPTLFALAYQGENDRTIQEQFASLIIPTSLPHKQLRASGKMHVAFISRFFKDHTIGQLNLGLVEKLNREHFDVTVFSVGDFRDATAMGFRQAADRYVVLPPQLAAARQMVLSHAPDVLFYTDLGMDPVTFSLAFSRLSPVQCTTWGHPVTSGIPAMDYFISSSLIEPADSQNQYSERLVILPHLSVYYHRPAIVGEKKTRYHFDLPEDAHVYGCLQMVWKFHPEFDELLAQILQRDPKGLLLLIQGVNKSWDEQLLLRWRRVMPEVVERIRFMPRVSREDFLCLTNLCDVMLDPIHFCGGNTSYEAFAFGVPVVTMPSLYLRGRLTYGMCREMGVMECAAASLEEYVETAVRIGCNPEYRRELSEKILSANGVLYENMEAVADLEGFFLGMRKQV